MALLQAMTSPAEAMPVPPPPTSGAARLGVIRLDPIQHPAERHRPQTVEDLPPPPHRGTLPGFVVEEGVIFEPQVEEDPSSRLELKGMFRWDLQRR